MGESIKKGRKIRTSYFVQVIIQLVRRDAITTSHVVGNGRDRGGESMDFEVVGCIQPHLFEFLSCQIIEDFGREDELPFEWFLEAAVLGSYTKLRLVLHISSGVFVCHTETTAEIFGHELG